MHEFWGHDKHLEFWNTMKRPAWAGPPKKSQAELIHEVINRSGGVVLYDDNMRAASSLLNLLEIHRRLAAKNVPGYGPLIDYLFKAHFAPGMHLHAKKNAIARRWVRRMLGIHRKPKARRFQIRQTHEGVPGSNYTLTVTDGVSVTEDRGTWGGLLVKSLREGVGGDTLSTGEGHSADLAKFRRDRYRLFEAMGGFVNRT